MTFRNRFVFGFTRHPKAVVGDGESTIRGLVDKANAKRARHVAHLRSKPFPLDALALTCLKARELTADTVLEDGHIAHLRPFQSKDSGGYNEVITDRVHPENIALVERISRFFRMESVGFDLITPDAALPWYDTGAAITELNWQPQIGENTATGTAGT